MPRARKESHPFNIRMDKEVYDRLTEHCAQSGQPKTTAVERAVMMYIDAWNGIENGKSKSPKGSSLAKGPSGK